MRIDEFIEGRCADERDKGWRQAPMTRGSILDPKVQRLVDSYMATVRMYRIAQEEWRTTPAAGDSYIAGYVSALESALENLATIWRDHPDYNLIGVDDPEVTATDEFLLRQEFGVDARGLPLGKLQALRNSLAVVK